MKPHPFVSGPVPDTITEWNWTHLGEVGLRLVIAGALGAVVAFRPWRRLMKAYGPPRSETSHAQVMICVAGAMMVVVIGDSLERAFGLVGLGAFIRFRAGIKDPRDAAVMFVMIGIGMACGLTLVPLAVGMAGMATILLVYFDVAGRKRARRLKVAIRATDLKAIVADVRAVFPTGRIMETWTDTGGVPREKTELVVEADLAADSDAATIMAIFESRGTPGLMSVTLEEE